jgi:hypothetical protein
MVQGGRRREEARERGRELLALPTGRLSDAERERVTLLLDWLERREPGRDWPGGGGDVHLTCVAEIETLWRREQPLSS